MDFLDPIKKRQRTVRLNIGHFLMVTLVVTGTYILVLRAQGYDIDPGSGEVIQNALVFVDSAPDGATIKVNGQEHKDRTNTKLALPDGSYRLELSKPDYRTWQREFAVSGGSVERFTYPLLVPQKLMSTELQSFDGLPTIATQSPDRKWVVLGQPGSIDTFIQYDLSNLVGQKPASAAFKLPRGLLTVAEGPWSWEFIEWSSDNKHVLFKHIFTGGQEFIMVNRDNPEQSLNINRELNQNPTDIRLRDKRSDRLYLHNQTDQSLKTADLKTKTTLPLLSGVLSFKSHGDDVLLYATIKPEDPAKARVFLRASNGTYTLRDIPISTNLPLDIAQFDNRWYAVVGSDAEQKAYIYKDPENVLKARDGRKPPIVSVLHSGGPISALSFSYNTRFVMINSGQHFNVYDAETQRSYRYDIADRLDPGSKPVWMDGHRMLIRSGGKVVVFDYDGINKQTLVPSEATIPIFFDRDYEVLYRIAPSAATAGKQDFIRTELRVLPK